MIAIATLDDPRIAAYRSLTDPHALVRAGLFVCEGRMVLRRLVTLRRFRIHSVLLTRTASAALDDVLPALEDVPMYVVDPSLMKAIVGFQIHRGCLALGERPPLMTLDDVDLAKARRLIVLEGVSNPDNVGGIFRSAAAFGVDAIVLGPECGDPLYRKAIRTSMAATLQVPYSCAANWPRALQTLRGNGFRLFALTPTRDACPLHDLPQDLERVALLVGAEGAGLSQEALAAADDRVRIPMVQSADSLNVTVAASIALYYFARAGPTSSPR